jgi:uncharacterized membrane protein YeiH
MLGAVVVVVAAQLGSLQDWVLWTAAAVVFTLRMLAVRLHLNAPTPLRSHPTKSPRRTTDAREPEPSSPPMAET